MIITFQELKEDDIASRLAAIRELGLKGLVDPSLGTLPVQARLLCEDAMFYTPPRNKAQGVRRVKLDYNKIFNPIDYTTIKDLSIKQIIFSGNVIAWERFASNPKSGDFYRKDAVTPTEELHAAWRDKRGRARQTRFVTLVPQQRKMKKLLTDSLSHLGYAKAGWLTGYLALGGTRAPSWVTRHGGAPGSFINGLSAEIPYIQINNNTKWGMYKQESYRIMTDALERRSRAMKRFYDETMRVVSEGKLTTWQTQQAALVAES